MYLRTSTSVYFHCPSTNQPFLSVYKKVKIQPFKSGDSFMNLVLMWEDKFGSAFLRSLYQDSSNFRAIACLQEHLQSA